MQDSNNEVNYIVEPNVEEHHVYKLTNYKEAVEKADIIAFLVNHKEFQNLDLSGKVVLDFCGTIK